MVANMPALSSFIPSYGKRKAKAVVKASSPFGFRRLEPSPGPTPHPYAPDVLDIGDNSGRAPEDYNPKASLDTQGSLRYTSTDTEFTPRVDIEITQEPITDWFSSLKSDPPPPETPVAGPSGSSSRSRNGAGLSAIYGVKRTESREDSMTSEEDEDGISISTSSEDVLANLVGMDASAFVTSFEEAPFRQEQLIQFTSSPSKKSPPTPIKIPNTVLYGPQVQVLRSGDATYTYGQSRPQSQLSSPESSAVSGTTLARALMGNAFVLSGDNRSSRYRSGFSGLTRSDSATLPRGEHPFLNSPFSDVTPGTGDIPPIPSDAGRLYVPPKTPRHSGLDPNETHKGASLKRRSSTGSILPRMESEPTTPVRSNSISIAPGDDTHLKEIRRISRISDGATSTTETPEIIMTAPPDAAGEQTSSSTPSSRSRSPLPPIPRSPNPSISPRQDLPTSLPTSPESNSSYPTSPEPSASTPGHSASSSTSSPNALGDVLDYYSFEQSPDGPADTSFRPAFSPISEESSSQLSPPIPYRRDSTRNTPIGARARTPQSPGLNGWTPLSRKMSEPRQSRQLLLPIGERPHSIQLSPTGTSPSTTHSALSYLTSSSLASPHSSGLIPPPVSRIFNRQRSGSAPSPIKVVRDSKDITAYNLTVTPLPESESAGSSSTTPTTGNSDLAAVQTFPETPSAFSPGFSPMGSSAGILRENSGEYVSAPPMPATPMSATLPSGSNIQPSLAQQILLTRATTSVHRARHSRQASLTQNRAISGNPYGRPSSPLTKLRHDIDEVPETSEPPADEDVTEQSAEETADRSLEEHPFLSESPIHENLDEARVEELPPPSSDHPSSSSLSVNGAGIPSRSPAPSTASRSPSREDSLVHTSEAGTSSTMPPSSPQIKTLPRIPPSPTIPPPPSPTQRRLKAPRSRPPELNLDNISSTRPTPDPGPVNVVPPVAEPLSSATLPLAPPVIPAPSISQLPPAVPPPPPLPMLPVAPPPPSLLPSVLSPSSVITPPSVTFSQPFSQAQDISPLPHPLFHRASSSGEFSALGSPPPYYSVVETGPHGEVTPSTGNSLAPPFVMAAPPLTPAVSIRNVEQAPVSRESTSVNRRTRMRPPLPAGPRRPSQQHSILSPTPGMGTRERNASVSTVGEASVRRQQPPLIASPKFQIPPMKYRGYTMEAAKWTFTSAQLQNIVSRAIKQSAEASSIRLLRLETLDNDIPDELRRLEMLRTGIKMDFKVLMRRRCNILDLLMSQFDGSIEQRDPSLGQRLVEDLKEITAAQDKLAQELHSLDEQIAQLENLKQIHSASALAMALRKLNASFLKQLAECEVMRKQVEILESERDEAWSQAEVVAQDFDRFLNTPSSDVGKRSSHIMAVRKSSIRASRAGLRSSRLSQRLSVASNGPRSSGINITSGTKSSFYMDDPPPVPPIPRRRPEDILTDLPSRNSAGFSSGVATSSSEMRVQDEVQEELCRMLGISMPQTRLRRSRSVIGLPSASLSPAPESILAGYRSPEVATPTRPSSLPGNSTLQEAYNAMSADGKAMLATLDMLAHDD